MGESPQANEVENLPYDGRSCWDEEACRDFIIYDLGYSSQIPRDYRYRQGIDEVRKRLMCRFGDMNLDRSMGIFNDILEKVSAHGIEDEADIWRSWRYSHLHQNVGDSPKRQLKPGLPLIMSGRSFKA